MKISPHTRGGLYTTLTINGHKNFIYGATEEEVDAKYTEMKYKHNQGYNINDNPTMEEYMKRWFKAFKEGEGAIETQNMYRNCINTHIGPALGNFKLKEITGTQVQSLIKSITSSKSLAHKVRITLNQIFKNAIADKLISFNPVAATKIIIPDKPKRHCLSPKQRELMLSILEDHKTFPLIMTTLYTGARMGESLALFWPDTDLKDKIVHITKATEYEHYRPKGKDTKTYRGVRDIPIEDPDYLAFMKQYKKSVRKSLYVFPGRTGGPMGLTEMRRNWKQARAKIKAFFDDEKNKELKEHEFLLTFRLLRHTFCTGLFDAGVDAVSAAELMGHDVKIMREVYTHIQDGRRKKTVDKLRSLYKEPKVIELKESK